MVEVPGVALVFAFIFFLQHVIDAVGDLRLVACWIRIYAQLHSVYERIAAVASAVDE